MSIDKKFISWIGSKRLLRKKISKLIPKDIGSYIEPFGGGGWVLFFKNKWANVEIYNDLDSQLVNLFRVVKYHPEEFLKQIQYILISRETFNEFLNTNYHTDIQKAVKFYYLVNRSFGGKQKDFGTSKVSPRASIKNSLSTITDICKRLDKVVIENKDFEELIRQYDYENAFFYCDPPYSSGAGYNVTSTKDFEHERLKNTLKNIKGRFLLSYDDSEFIRELYKDFEIVEVDRMNGINHTSTQKNKKYKELLIANYPIKGIL